MLLQDERFSTDNDVVLFGGLRFPAPMNKEAYIHLPIEGSRAPRDTENEQILPHNHGYSPAWVLNFMRIIEKADCRRFATPLSSDPTL